MPELLRPTLPEAIACGTTVIATRVGGMPKSSSMGSTGFIVAPGDPTALGLRRGDAAPLDNVITMAMSRGPREIIARLLLGSMQRRSRVLAKLMTRLTFRKLIGPEGRLLAYRKLGARIGDEVFVGARTSIRFPENVVIGDGSLIGDVAIEAWGPVVIGRDVMINSNVSLFTAQHDVDSPTFEGDVQSIHVGDHAWLPHHIRVLPGVRIGRCAVIGTGSVVTRDVPDYGVAVGSPARVVKERARIEYQYRASRIGR